MEYWSTGIMGLRVPAPTSNTPPLQYSNLV